MMLPSSQTSGTIAIRTQAVSSCSRRFVWQILGWEPALPRTVNACSYFLGGSNLELPTLVFFALFLGP
jgi:hypothetical protein